MKNIVLGDTTKAVAPDEIDIDRIDFFDSLEHECWFLFKLYAGKLGIQLEKTDNSYEEDFSISKEIQETILNIFERNGIKINYPSEG